MTLPSPRDPLRHRVLLVLSTARDAELTVELLARDGIQAQACVDGAQLVAEMRRGVGAVLVSEEMLGLGAQATLAQALEEQPHWSDLPVLVLTHGGADSLEVGDAVAMLGNVTLLERPLRVAGLMSSVHSALRARHRQYEIENHLRQLELARDLEATSARRKDEFLAMLAHELRNPLAPIRNALYVLSLDDSDAARRTELRTMMLRQVDHMVRLVDDLLEASRLSRGMITLHREPLDLRKALRAAVDLSRPLIDAGRYQLRVDLPDAPLPIDADPVRIAQVFSNLLNNAAKYGHAGGHVSVTARREAGAACVRIEDDGKGIAGEDLPHVFELFVQGSRANHGVQEGLGIGLALVRTLVELHGGTVTAHSEGLDRGARFDVRLPLAAQSDAVPSPEAGPASFAGLRVLVVDDNADAAGSLALVLDVLGAKHHVAHDGAAALRAVETFRPHVVLLDIGMPDMDGYEVARRLRRQPRHAGLLLVAVSGWSQAADLRRSSDAGIDHHMAKPVDIAQLSMLLEDACRALPRAS